MIKTKNKHIVAVFGGTFDPPHIGHTALVKQVLNHNIAHSILFIPAPNPPHKQKQRKTPFKHRLNMLKLATANIPNTDISLIENETPNNLSYTYNTMQLLAQQFKQSQIKLLIGGDSLQQLHTWYNSKKLVNEFEFIIYPRGDGNLSEGELNPVWSKQEQNKLLNAQYNFPMHDISSTEIRNRIKTQQDVASLLHKGVLSYIKKHALY